MSSCREAIRVGLVALLVIAAPLAAAGEAGYPQIGRPATESEVRAWDIDVRPDFRGLPKGQGSVAKGQEVWETKCESCHGVFGESNQVFSPIVGGTTREDVQTGRVARLTDRGFPGRTTLMKLPTLSSLWDYINRAMPWNAPKSLTVEEVYGVTAYVLNLGGIVPDDFTLSDTNAADVQRLLPNRDGMTTDHALWPGATMGGGKPDVQATACMSDCVTEPKVASLLPDHARDAHGNLAQQNRLVGAQVGADTTKPEGAPPTRPVMASAAAATQAAPADGKAASTPPAASGGSAAGGAGTVDAGAPSEGVKPEVALALAARHTCTACHGLDNRVVGPSFRDIAKKHGPHADAIDYLAGKIKSGGSGVWGQIPMPPQALPEADARLLARWLAAGAPK